MQFLKSLVSVGVLSAADYGQFMGSLETVTSQMSADLAKVSREEFLLKYGHLGPGTYDVLSPRYDEAPERYFTWPRPPAGVAANARPQFALSPAQSVRLEAMLQAHGLAHDVTSLFHFIKSAIEGREYSKFVFTRSLSDALSLLTGFAQGLGISRDDVSYADIGVICQLYSTSNEPVEMLRQSLAAGRDSYEVTRSITLPPLITSEQDAETFRVGDDGVLLEIGKRAWRVEDIQGQYMGLLKFTPSGWRVAEDYIGAQTTGRRDRMEMTSLMQGLLGKGVAIAALPAWGRWSEVDSESDLKLYETLPAVAAP